MRTIIAALFATAAALPGTAAGPASSALAAPAPVHQDTQWCPGQPWDEAWGVNEDFEHCHGIAGSEDEAEDDDDQGLDRSDPDPDLGQDLPPKYKDGDYPPDYDWSEEYGDNHGGKHG